MIDTELIPDQQKHRLLIQTDHRGQVTSAQVIDESLLYSWIEKGILPPECMDASMTLLEWEKSLYGFLDAKTAKWDGMRGELIESREMYSELRRMMDKRDLQDIEQFLKAHRSDWQSYWPLRFDLQSAYKNLIKIIDSLR